MSANDQPRWLTDLELNLAAGTVRRQRLSGGDINDAYCLELDDGRRVFAKTHPSPPPGMFRAEARGLEFLREAGALRIPQVFAVSDDPDAAYLALEYLRQGSRQSDFDERLGRGLAELHGTDPAQSASGPLASTLACEPFGLDFDNYIGKLPQRNDRASSWSGFYWEMRLEPQLRRAVEGRLLGKHDQRLFDKLHARLPQLVEGAQPARLHGDLWGGNLHSDPQGAPVLIDPAPYVGDAEVDLAMMKLFGGFSESVFAAYWEASPPRPGVEQRVALYQLYPLMVHVNLFGAGYVHGVRSALARLV